MPPLGCAQRHFCGLVARRLIPVHPDSNSASKPCLAGTTCLYALVGYSLNLNAALVILLASRLTFTLIRETPLNLVIPFDKLFPAFHIYVGYTIAVASVGHAVFHIIWIVRWDGWAPGLWGINMVGRRCRASLSNMLGIYMSTDAFSVAVRRNWRINLSRIDRHDCYVYTPRSQG